MNNHFWLGMAVILSSGAMNAGFSLPMKSSRGWKWENLWLVFSTVGILIVPWTLALALVPGLPLVYAGVRFSQLYGLTETTGPITALPHEHHVGEKLLSCGRPMFGGRARIVATPRAMTCRRGKWANFCIGARA